MGGGGFGISCGDVHLLSETKVYEATLALCHVEGNLKRENI